MSGHSKWATIKHKKAKTDAARSKNFSKLIKELTTAAKHGGSDITGNSRLRLLVDKAKEINMPHENITRAIKRGTGELPGVSYEEMRYEGYGPGGIALIIDVLTDNKNKAAADLRYVFNRKGGNLAETNAVSWMFNQVGTIRLSSPNLSEEKLLDMLLEFDIQDITSDNSLFTIYCAPKSLDEVKQALIKAGYTPESAELEWSASNLVSLSKAEEDKAFELLQALEDLDDVQNVYTNLG